jgi:cell division transport system permease protein
VTVAGWPAAAGALPIARDPVRWSLAAIAAVMAYLAALGGIGLIALGDARRDWQGALGGVLTLQLPAETSQARLEVVLALVRQTTGASGAQVLDPAEIARLLEPWLGTSVPLDILPLPRLIDIHVDPALAIDVEGLQQRLNSVAPEARLDDHRVWLFELLSVSSRLQAIVIAIIIAAATVTVLAALVTASSAVTRNGERIALLHALGADDFDIAARFVIPVIGMALLGGAVGALAAAGTWQIVAAAAGSLGFTSFSPTEADRRVMLLLAAATLAIPVIAATAAAIVSRRAVARLP